MSTSTHMGTYPCICSSSQQHSSLQMSHLLKLASCSLSPVAEEWELQDNLIQTGTQFAKHISIHLFIIRLVDLCVLTTTITV